MSRSQNHEEKKGNNIAVRIVHQFLCFFSLIYSMSYLAHFHQYTHVRANSNTHTQQLAYFPLKLQTFTQQMANISMYLLHSQFYRIFVCPSTLPCCACSLSLEIYTTALYMYMNWSTSKRNLIHSPREVVKFANTFLKYIDYIQRIAIDTGLYCDTSVGGVRYVSINISCMETSRNYRYIVALRIQMNRFADIISAYTSELKISEKQKN